MADHSAGRGAGMTSEPLPAECAEVRRRLAEGDAGREMLDHLASCQSCSAFAAALVELEAQLAQLPRPEPPAGAADRAIARFRAEVTAHSSPSEAPVAPQRAAPPLMPAGPPLSPPPSAPSGTAPQSQPPSARLPKAGQARKRRWRSPVSLVAAGVAAAIALVVVLVAVLGPASTAPAYAAILHEAAVRTGAEKSARLDLTGTIGLSLRGQKVTAALSGTGATEFPDRGELTEVDAILGRPLLKQHIVSVGNRAWARLNDGQWVVVPIPPDHASPIDQALAYPAQALDDLTRVGSGYRSLGTTTVNGTRVRQIQLTIPGASFHPFGDLSERASRWTVVVDVTQGRLILRRLTITGRGVVGMLETKVPFTYSLQLTLRDFGARVSIQPPVSNPSPRCAHCRPGSTGSSPATTPGALTGPSSAPPGSMAAQPGSQSPEPGRP